MKEKEAQDLLDAVFAGAEKAGAPILAARATVRAELHRQLLALHDIEDDLLAPLVDHLRRIWQQSRVVPGECVGVLCAQSIGERQTQNTLNSFHTAGTVIETVVTGVPRFLEILNATKQPKLTSSAFRVRAPVSCFEDIRRILGPRIVCLSLRKLLLRYSIHERGARPPWLDTYLDVYPTEDPAPALSRPRPGDAPCILMELDPVGIYKHGVRPDRIRDALERVFQDVRCVFSPMHKGEVMVCVDASVVTGTERPLPPFLAEEDPIRVYLEDVVLPQVLDSPIGGLEGIEDYFIGADLTVRTRGNNFIGLLGMSCLDQTTVLSNNMWDIYRGLGIEAANAWLMTELMSITSADGTYMNPAHLMLLVDVMTHHGTIVSISRYALKKEQVGPLAKASFEECLDNFLKAGFYVDTDNTRGVSASIMCGKRSKAGTGMVDLLFEIP